MFLNGTVEDKRFISQTVISNSSYYDGKLDVELPPVFDTLFRLSRIHEQNKLTIEPPKTQSKCTKKAPEGANFKNGGVDVARFELFKKFYEHLNDTPTARKICYLISSLRMVA